MREQAFSFAVLSAMTVSPCGIRTPFVNGKRFKQNSSPAYTYWRLKSGHNNLGVKLHPFPELTGIAVITMIRTAVKFCLVDRRRNEL